MSDLPTLASRVRRKLGRGKARAKAWLQAPRLRRWQAANAAGTRLFAENFQRSPSSFPQAAWDQLNADHRYYVTNISVGSWTASWNFVTVLVRLLSTGLFTTVVDFGSGFTSYAVRYWSREAGVELDLATVDDNAGWLAKTRTYLQRGGVSSEHLYLEGDYVANGSPRAVDLLIYDYSGFEVRTRFLPELARFIRPGSIILFDDYNLLPHTVEYRAALDAWALAQSLQLVDLKAFTLDNHGRTAAIGYHRRAKTFPELLKRL